MSSVEYGQTLVTLFTRLDDLHKEGPVHTYRGKTLASTKTVIFSELFTSPRPLEGQLPIYKGLRALVYAYTTFTAPNLVIDSQEVLHQVTSLEDNFLQRYRQTHVDIGDEHDLQNTEEEIYASRSLFPLPAQKVRYQENKGVLPEGAAQRLEATAYKEIISSLWDLSYFPYVRDTVDLLASIETVPAKQLLGEVAIAIEKQKAVSPQKFNEHLFMQEMLLKTHEVVYQELLQLTKDRENGLISTEGEDRITMLQSQDSFLIEAIRLTVYGTSKIVQVDTRRSLWKLLPTVATTLDPNGLIPSDQMKEAQRYYISRT